MSINSGKRALSDDQIERNLFLDSLTVGLMEHWRHFHLPLTAVFTVLAIVHIVSIIYSHTNIFNRSKHQKSSSKAQIAAYLLVIVAVAERGGIILLGFSQLSSFLSHRA